jgi:hypothetical protein
MQGENRMYILSPDHSDVFFFFFSSTLISSATNPTIAAGLCASWVVGRILYTLGYTTGDPKKV